MELLVFSTSTCSRFRVLILQQTTTTNMVTARTAVAAAAPISTGINCTITVVAAIHTSKAYAGTENLTRTYCNKMCPGSG